MITQGKMKRVTTWVGTCLIYGFGVLSWWTLFGYLHFQCLFNVIPFVDGLWTKDLHDGLVKNMIGEIAFRANNGYGDYGCGDKYIYRVTYPRRPDNGGEKRSLSSLVDVATWRYVGSENVIATYVDSKHRYFVRSISDGVDISAEDR
jgi:hypothetical protein